MLVFLKLGGSLITEKDKPFSPRMDVLERLGKEISAALKDNPDLRIVLGHGSGSFGHVAADQHKTRDGVVSPDQWKGFIEVWKAARSLNQIVIESLSKSKIPIYALPPSATFITQNGRVKHSFIQPIKLCLSHGIVPLINGDVIFDLQIGGTILSTEEIFSYLAPKLNPTVILLAGIEEGVWEDFPICKSKIDRITPTLYNDFNHHVKGSVFVDVTGGMYEKVRNMVALVKKGYIGSAQIFSALEPGTLKSVLSGASSGTIIKDLDP